MNATCDHLGLKGEEDKGVTALKRRPALLVDQSTLIDQSLH